MLMTLCVVFIVFVFITINDGVYAQMNSIKTQYCAIWDPATTGGATGYFAMQLQPSSGVALYQFQLTLPTPSYQSCNVSQYGLKYHIHSYWTGTASTSLEGNTPCTSATGGHYDPNFACSTKSQGYVSPTTGQCANLSRTAAYGYTYTCTPSIFNSGQFSACEVGDTSGKFGVALASNPKALSNIVFSSNGVLTDPLPPYVYNYNQVGITSNMWYSMVRTQEAKDLSIYLTKQN